MSCPDLSCVGSRSEKIQSCSPNGCTHTKKCPRICSTCRALPNAPIASCPSCKVIVSHSDLRICSGLGFTDNFDFLDRQKRPVTHRPNRPFACKLCIDNYPSKDVRCANVDCPQSRSHGSSNILCEECVGRGRTCLTSDDGESPIDTREWWCPESECITLSIRSRYPRIVHQCDNLVHHCRQIRTTPSLSLGRIRIRRCETCHFDSTLCDSCWVQGHGKCANCFKFICTAADCSYLANGCGLQTVKTEPNQDHNQDVERDPDDDGGDTRTPACSPRWLCGGCWRKRPVCAVCRYRPCEQCADEVSYRGWTPGSSEKWLCAYCAGDEDEWHKWRKRRFCAVCGYKPCEQCEHEDSCHGRMMECGKKWICEYCSGDADETGG